VSAATTPIILRVIKTSANVNPENLGAELRAPPPRSFVNSLIISFPTPFFNIYIFIITYFSKFSRYSTTSFIE